MGSQSQSHSTPGHTWNDDSLVLGGMHPRIHGPDRNYRRYRCDSGSGCGDAGEREAPMIDDVTVGLGVKPVDDKASLDVDLKQTKQ